MISYKKHSHLVGRTLPQFLGQALRFPPGEKGGILFRARVDYPIGSGNYLFKFSEEFLNKMKKKKSIRIFKDKPKKVKKVAPPLDPEWEKRIKFVRFT